MIDAHLADLSSLLYGFSFGWIQSRTWLGVEATLILPVIITVNRLSAQF